MALSRGVTDAQVASDGHPSLSPQGSTDKDHGRNYIKIWLPCSQQGTGDCCVGRRHPVPPSPAGTAPHPDSLSLVPWTK